MQCRGPQAASRTACRTPARVQRKGRGPSPPERKLNDLSWTPTLSLLRPVKTGQLSYFSFAMNHLFPYHSPHQRNFKMLKLLRSTLALLALVTAFVLPAHTHRRSPSGFALSRSPSPDRGCTRASWTRPWHGLKRPEPRRALPSTTSAPPIPSTTRTSPSTRS